MALTPDQNLLHYRLLAKIGEGGMGVVWKARDTSLDRDAAIKILPKALAQDAERLARFEREAKVLATLNHPNIAGIYGFHDAEGVRFLAMELVEGAPLDQRLSSGPLPLDEALELAGQLAAALEAAHARAIVHRDLKPANVVLGDDGVAKVLDFGLAKALTPEPLGSSGSSLSMSPTVTSAGTMVGTILGTAAYMSPEQARGKAVDQRADLWSFGIVLFEMLTGQRPFDGDTVTDILGAILHREPDWELLPAATPSSVRRLLRRCLVKDTRRRLHSAADARLELEDAGSEPDVVVEETARRRRGLLRLLPVVVPALLLGGLAGWVLRPHDPAATLPVRRLTVVSDALSITGGSAYDKRQVLDISRDGELIAFVGEDRIFLRRLDQSNPVPVPGTEGASIVALSPDGEWLGFAQGSYLRKIPLGGGAPVDVARLSQYASSMAWSRDGTIYFAGGHEGYLALFRVPDRGGTPELLVEPSDENGTRRDLGSPQLIDDDRKLLFTSTRGNVLWHPDNSDAVVLDLASGEERVVAKGVGFARYVPSGHLLLAKGANDFLLLPFDLERLETTGAGVPLRGELVAHRNGMVVHLAFSDDGTLVYEAGTGGEVEHELVWFGLDGSRVALSSEKRAFHNIRLARGGERAILGIGEDQGKLWLYDLARDSLTKLTVDDHDYQYPVWTPDGGSVIYLRSLRGQNAGIYRQDVPAEREPELMFEPGTIWYVPDNVSPDGRWLAGFIWDVETDTHWDVEIVSLEGEITRERFSPGPHNEWFPRFSPDGGWLAYTSDRSGQNEVYIKRFPERGAPIQVSRGGGRRPLWSRSGDELYYLAEWKAALMRVEIELGASPRVGEAQSIELSSDLMPQDWYPWGSVAADGRLALVRRSTQTAGHVNVVLNWFDELRELAP